MNTPSPVRRDTLRTLEADLVVVGSGVAGLSAALAAARQAPVLRILLVTPVAAGADGATALAQGGIAAALGDDDDPRLHALDTLRAAGGGADPERVEILAREGPARVLDLEDRGAEFDRGDGGELALGLEGAHTRRRIVHASGDRTGREVARALAGALSDHPSIRILAGYRAVELLLAEEVGPEDACVVVRGVRVEAMGSGRDADGPGGEAEPASPRIGSPTVPRARGSAGGGSGIRDGAPADALTLLSGRVLLATGGAAGLFQHSTASPHALGEGLALALAAGARLEGMEFIQFHPTALDVPARPLPLVTEALRGEGAILVDEAGTPLFPGDAGAGVGSLASRDQVARRIWAHRARGGKVFLDAREAVGDDFPRRFPGVYATCMAHGIDPRREPIPVTPAAHYHMGGIAVDAEGRSTVPGLLAAGEVAWTGVHGANRLASNSLLEGLVFGERAGRIAALEVQEGSPPRAATGVIPGPGGPAGDGTRTFAPRERGDAPSSSEGLPVGLPPFPVTSLPPSTPLADAEDALRAMLWEGAGMVRNRGGMVRALEGIQALNALTEGREARGWVRFRGQLAVARAMVEAALRREHSLGSHFRDDAPPSDGGAAPAHPPPAVGASAASVPPSPSHRSSSRGTSRDPSIHPVRRVS